MAHQGECYSNSNLVPASAEEPHSTIVARELLLDKNGKYVGDDRAIFAGRINADNDTRGPAAFIREQNRIIGEPAEEYNIKTTKWRKALDLVSVEDWI